VCRDADGRWRSESATSHFSEDTGHVANLVGRVRARGSAPRSLRADAHHSGSRKETAWRERAALGDGRCGLHPNVHTAPHLSSSAVALMLSSAQLREDQRPSWPLQRKAKTSEFRPGAFERCRPAGGVRPARARSGSDHAKARVLSRANYIMADRGLSRCFSLNRPSRSRLDATTEQIYARAATTTASPSPRAPSTSGHSNCRKVACQPTAASPGAAELRTRSATSLRSRCVFQGRTEQELSKRTTGVANTRAIQLQR